MFLKLSQNLQEKICVEVSFFNKVAGYRPVTLLKKRLWHRCFHVSSLKFLRTPSFVKHGGGFYNQSFQATYIFPKLCTHVHKPFSTHLSQKKTKRDIILKVPPALNINWDAHINFSVIPGHFDELLGKKVNTRKNYK